MTTTDATYRKEIVFDRETRDYAMRLDGELVGYVRSYHEAEITLDELVFELLSSGATATASALDGDSDADECAADVEALVIRGDDPTRVSACIELTAEPIGQCYVCDAAAWQSDAYGPVCPSHSAVLDEWKEQQATEARQRCLLCGGDHSAEDCPRIHPIDATALLEEADAVIGRLYCPNCLGNHLLQDCPLKHGDHATEADVLLSQTASHPGPNCYCPACMRAAERLIVDAYITRLQVDAGLICQFCGDDHADTTCPPAAAAAGPACLWQLRRAALDPALPRGARGVVCGIKQLERQKQ